MPVRPFKSKKKWIQCSPKRRNNLPGFLFIVAHADVWQLGNAGFDDIFWSAREEGSISSIRLAGSL